MNSRKKQVTPAYVSELSKCEIFVFGSNLEGRHRGGAARTAHEKFGAEWGVGDGPSYWIIAPFSFRIAQRRN